MTSCSAYLISWQGLPTSILRAVFQVNWVNRFPLGFLPALVPEEKTCGTVVHCTVPRAYVHLNPGLQISGTGCFYGPDVVVTKPTVSAPWKKHKALTQTSSLTSSFFFYHHTLDKKGIAVFMLALQQRLSTRIELELNFISFVVLCFLLCCIVFCLTLTESVRLGY